MKRFCLLAVLLILAGLNPGWAASTCRSPGVVCLFVDGSGCAITCDGNCWVTTGGCIFGFGYDAICRCHDKKNGCKTSCQDGLSKSTGQFGLAVNSILTQCERDAAATGRHGGDCYFDPSAREAIETARADALAAIHSVCTNQDVFNCFGIATVDDLASRLLKNAESSYAGANRAIFDDGPPGQAIETTPKEPFIQH